MTTKRRGALIVVEGLDRAGKSTQHKLISERLETQGHRVNRLSFPDRSTAIGKSIDAYLRGASQVEDHVIHLLFSANRWEAAESIREAIESGTTVVIDRYYYSGVVYSASKQNPLLSFDWARRPEVGLPRPDLCLFLDITPEKAAERGGYGNERYEKREMQARVRKLFHDMFKAGDEEEDARVIDAGKSMDQVTNEAWTYVIELLHGEALTQPLRTIR